MIKEETTHEEVQPEPTCQHKYEYIPVEHRWACVKCKEKMPETMIEVPF